MLTLQNISISKHLSSTRTTTLILTCFVLISSLLILINYPSTTNTLLSTLSFQLFSFSNTTNSFANNNSNVDPPSNKKHCDIFDGRWVYDDSYPVYDPSSCPYVEPGFSCFNNGRHDLGYLKYRWQPYGCDIPRFDAKKMMEMLRGKRLVFVGDSLSRNMCQSLICHLMAFKGQTYRSGLFYNYYFKDYNCSISLITAPFLVQQHKLPNKKETLRLDTMEATISKYRDADFLIFNTGHWWNPNKSKNGENFFQEGDVIQSNMTVGVAYTKALKTWAKWVDTNVNTTKTKVFFRGYANTHFRGGDWDTKGTCHNEITPITDEKLLKPYSWLMQTLETVISEMKTPVIYLNITKSTAYRKDGHPSIYRYPGSKLRLGVIQDCSHWCLPGVPDSWNQLLYASLLFSSKGFNMTT
ncbi:protein trichome birefringence-like 4 [Spinacia oleracea]|uniref:Protein trichome birefringence-like 4 n=1 Tax=Spinacia oleracea TaxID=3562 RepID=A0A9R0HR72_SPIOL|nr:protein trichome birefringence-like 4 [Spinacia oleracea]